MIVVADTSPINYPIQIECVALLHELYNSILIPVAVADELRHHGAPAEIRRWMNDVPDWVVVRSGPVTDI